MTVINNIDNEIFSFNGINYYKNFMPLVVGDKVRILNVYDSCIELTDFPTLYSEFTVDGNTFANVADLQTALLPVIYTRASLNLTIPNGKTISSNIATTYNIDWSAADHWELTMTANTTITESNIPAAGEVKTITIELSGNFSPTLPVSWNPIGSSYDGTNGSQIVAQSWDNGSYRVVINDVV